MQSSLDYASMARPVRYHIHNNSNFLIRKSPCKMGDFFTSEVAQLVERRDRKTRRSVVRFHPFERPGSSPVGG